LRTGSVNVGTMSGSSVEIDEMVLSRYLDFCCLQETRWKGSSARYFREYKFYGLDLRKEWQVADKGIDKVLKFKRISSG